MNILIVEDDRIKAERIRIQVELVLEEIGQSCAVRQAGSYNSGVRACLRERPSLVILDMTMPTFDIKPTETGGKPRHFAGRDILWELSRRNLYFPTVVLTGFDVIGEGNEQQNRDELTIDLKRLFPRNFLGTIFYSPVEVSWKSELATVIKDMVEQIEAK